MFNDNQSHKILENLNKFKQEFENMKADSTDLLTVIEKQNQLLVQKEAQKQKLIKLLKERSNKIVALQDENEYLRNSLNNNVDVDYNEQIQTLNDECAKLRNLNEKNNEELAEYKRKYELAKAELEQYKRAPEDAAKKLLINHPTFTKDVPKIQKQRKRKSSSSYWPSLDVSKSDTINSSYTTASEAEKSIGIQKDTADEIIIILSSDEDKGETSDSNEKKNGKKKLILKKRNK